MASVRLGRYEAEEGRLPPVCVCCGEPADEYKSRQFSWYPPWVNILIITGLLPFAIVALVLTKRLRARLPLCEAHRGHWLWRTVTILVSLALVILLGIGAIVLLAALDRNPRVRDASAFICLGVAGLGLGWLILVAVLQTTAIRPTEITDRDITLTRVSEEFAAAVRSSRRRRDEDDDRYERPRRRRPRYEDEEEDEYYER